MLLLQVIASAKQDSYWAADREQAPIVSIGYYHSRAAFHTFFLHEATHCLLILLGRNTAAHVEETDIEERFCWMLARELSRACSLPYDTQLENLYFQLWQEMLQCSGKDVVAVKPHLENIDRILGRQRDAFGISGFDQTSWTTDGRPHVAS